MTDRFTPTRLLLVEDNPDDIEILTRALAQTDLHHQLFVTRDGYEALEFLFYKGTYAKANHPRPDLILLDLNLPRVTGFDVLKIVRGSAEYRAVPVIIMSSSISREDVALGYRLGANTYIQKQANLVHAMKVLGEYWGIFAKLPPVSMAS
jgi:CheY-like chemotaxis protein